MSVLRIPRKQFCLLAVTFTDLEFRTLGSPNMRQTHLADSLQVIWSMMKQAHSWQQAGSCNIVHCNLMRCTSKAVEQNICFVTGSYFPLSVGWLSLLSHAAELNVPLRMYNVSIVRLKKCPVYYS
jgi:hypothetical protein